MEMECQTVLKKKYKIINQNKHLISLVLKILVKKLLIKALLLQGFKKILNVNKNI
jgi:hypothetical protein